MSDILGMDLFTTGNWFKIVFRDCLYTKRFLKLFDRGNWWINFELIQPAITLLLIMTNYRIRNGTNVIHQLLLDNNSSMVPRINRHTMKSHTRQLLPLPVYFFCVGKMMIVLIRTRVYISTSITLSNNQLNQLIDGTAIPSTHSLTPADAFNSCAFTHFSFLICN